MKVDTKKCVEDVCVMALTNMSKIIYDLVDLLYFIGDVMMESLKQCCHYFGS